MRKGRIESIHSIKRLDWMGSWSNVLGVELRMLSFTVNFDTFK